MMKYLSIPVLLGLCVVVQAKSPQHTVNGITLNDSLAKVQQQLGKPTRQNMTSPNECNDDQPDMQLHYPGMLVTLSKGGNNQFSVSSIDITAASRSVSGVRIGDSATQVKRVFGNGDTSNNVIVYDAAPQSGQTYEFTLRGGKVSHIKFNSYMC